MEKRNQAIDLVKIFAMIGVMALHSTIDETDRVVGYVLSRVAGISVPLFFMVSGYLLSRKKITWEYSLNKIKGILRFCLLMCFFYWLLLGVIKGSWPTMVIWDFFGGFFQHGHLWMFWYFGAMILIYLLLPYFKTLLVKQSTVIVLFCIISLVFCLNVGVGLEERYVNQTLRVWNWLFYFSLGAYMHKRLERRAFPSFLVGLLACFCAIFYACFTYVFYDRLPGIEYYFGSIGCVLYAIVVFVFLAGLQIENSRVVAMLSSLFLPVYALHWEVRGILRFVDTSFLGVCSPLAQFVLLSLTTISVSWLLMKIPVLNKCFKI